MKTYYQFWMEGENLAEDEDFDTLVSFVERAFSTGDWQPLNTGDYQFIKCEIMPVSFKVSFKI